MQYRTVGTVVYCIRRFLEGVNDLLQSRQVESLLCAKSTPNRAPAHQATVRSRYSRRCAFLLAAAPPERRTPARRSQACHRS